MSDFGQSHAALSLILSSTESEGRIETVANENTSIDRVD
jgi:hypothetical protein